MSHRVVTELQIVNYKITSNTKQTSALIPVERRSSVHVMTGPLQGDHSQDTIIFHKCLPNFSLQSYPVNLSHTVVIATSTLNIHGYSTETFTMI